MSQPIVHHRTKDFRLLLDRLLDRLQAVHRTENDLLLFAASGTGGMDGAVANLCSPGDRVLCVSAGNFGERWVQLAEAYGCDVVPVRYEWGETPQPDDVAAALEEAGGARAVFLTHSETSTGVVADVDAIARRLGGSGALTVVDAISSLGAVPLSVDESGIDVVVSGSQKALMTPPGLATTSVSAAALAAAREGRSPRFYFDWARNLKALQGDPPATVFTSAVSLVYGLDAALGLILEEGLDAVFERHVRLGRACRAGVKAMGLELFSPDDGRSAVVTAIHAPDGIDSGELVQTLRDRLGIVLAPGQGPLKGRIFRIGHIGYYDIFDITTALTGVELVLAERGADIERGAAVTAALEAFEHTPV